MKRSKKAPARPEEPRFWVEWFRGSIRCAPNEACLFAWLPGTMTTEELIALKVAADQFNADIKIHRNGSGEVVRKDLICQQF